jgi:hypothetical protein
MRVSGQIHATAALPSLLIKLRLDGKEKIYWFWKVNGTVDRPASCIVAIWTLYPAVDFLEVVC